MNDQQSGQDITRMIGDWIARKVEAEVDRVLAQSPDENPVIHVNVEGILRDVFAQVDAGTFLHAV